VILAHVELPQQSRQALSLLEPANVQTDDFGAIGGEVEAMALDQRRAVQAGSLRILGIVVKPRGDVLPEEFAIPFTAAHEDGDCLGGFGLALSRLVRSPPDQPVCDDRAGAVVRAEISLPFDVGAFLLDIPV